jgi:hypothetical protein
VKAPRAIPGEVLAAVARGTKLCVARAGGRVECSADGDVAKLEPIAGLDGTNGLAVDGAAVCAIGARRDVSCAGFRHHGGYDDMPWLVPEKAAKVAGLADVESIALASSTLWARTKSGALLQVQLALGPGASPNAAARAPGIEDARGLAASSDVACVLRAGGDLACLRAGDALKTFAVGAASIAAGPSHFCAALRAGGAVCWGEGTWSQIGNGALGYRAGAADVALPP